MRTVKQREATARWRIKNHDRVLEYYRKTNIQYYKSRRDFINTCKSNPCTDCKISYPPCVMDFDHRDPSIKKFNIGASLRKPITVLTEEIEKCDLVCANCHRLRTQERLDNGRHRKSKRHRSRLDKSRRTSEGREESFNRRVDPQHQQDERVRGPEVSGT